MQSVLFFSDKQVREKLFGRVDATRGLLLVTGVRHGPTQRSPELREPFAALEDVFGEVLSQVLVADEGGVDGMWRDPLGDLGERLYPNDKKAAYAASTGYLLLQDGRPRLVVRKHGPPAEDLWFIQEALSRLSPRVPPPDPARRPGARRPEPAPRAPRAPEAEDLEDTPPPRPRPRAAPPAPEPRKVDPWTVLGIARGTSADEARRAFRALIAQYHPDKVAHLAPEFHALAERRTREILDAWAEVERELG
ncbi:DnaJ domain-containing protein [Corallococcus sp. M34]|uniref:DnaJ domain-containing protein n=1 Tax=Citreicoccus inhibens TaxID=2849499 RepID=UPI001C215FA0|nr:DnaJ domain-containing protein [Citreicoccus inhibens]MBU8899387.1 DnaJ domain-containing protein [Citreicoccus inhibens]